MKNYGYVTYIGPMPYFQISHPGVSRLYHLTKGQSYPILSKKDKDYFEQYQSVFKVSDRPDRPDEKEDKKGKKGED